MNTKKFISAEQLLFQDSFQLGAAILYSAVLLQISLSSVRRGGTPVGIAFAGTIGLLRCKRQIISLSAPLYYTGINQTAETCSSAWAKLYSQQSYQIKTALLLVDDVFYTGASMQQITFIFVVNVVKILKSALQRLIAGKQRD